MSLGMAWWEARITGDYSCCAVIGHQRIRTTHRKDIANYAADWKLSHVALLFVI
jgi:hypothetical protein